MLLSSTWHRGHAVVLVVVVSLLFLQARLTDTRTKMNQQHETTQKRLVLRNSHRFSWRRKDVRYADVGADVHANPMVFPSGMVRHRMTHVQTNNVFGILILFKMGKQGQKETTVSTRASSNTGDSCQDRQGSVVDSDGNDNDY